MVKIYIGIGSNIGARRKNIYRAVVQLVLCREFRLLGISPLYETSAVSVAGGTDFLNCAVKAETGLLPEEVLSKLKSIELKLGRKPVPEKRKWAPRIIDLDILLYGRRVIRTGKLTVPHPRMTARKFALKPLLDLDSGMVHPESGMPFRKIYREIRDRSQKIGEYT